jgi:hypothetical protein
VYAIRDRAETSIAQVNTEGKSEIIQAGEKIRPRRENGDKQAKSPYQAVKPRPRQPHLAQGSLGETQLRSEPEVAMGDK